MRAFALALALALGSLAACHAPGSATRHDDGDGDEGEGDGAGEGEGEGEGEGGEGEGGEGEGEGEGEGDAAPSALSLERDRLLGTLGERCAVWGGLDDDQRAEFLVVTDLLAKSDASAGVTRLYAIRGRQQSGCVRCCGDREFNRVFFAVDDALIARFRAHDLPGWRASHDPGGPHAPFTQSDETEVGAPRGQVQLFASDADAVPLARPGVEDVNDPRAVEIDLDFNTIHESAPLCTYAGDTGLARYESVWGDAELDYAPACTP